MRRSFSSSVIAWSAACARASGASFGSSHGWVGACASASTEITTAHAASAINLLMKRPLRRIFVEVRADHQQAFIIQFVARDNRPERSDQIPTIAEALG